MDFAKHTDDALLVLSREAYARGETWTVQAAFDELVIRHQDRIQGRLRLKLPADEADDQAQEVFLALFDTVVTGKDIGHVRGWLNTVAANKVADFHRGRAGRHLKTVREGLPLDAEHARELRGEGAEYDRVHDALVIDALVEQRSPVHRAVIHLAVLEGRSAKDVSAATGESEANVYQVASRFRKDLRAALDNSTHDRT